MAISDDFTVAANGDIRSDSPAQNWTVIEFHRWLQELADDAAAAGDDILDITSVTPSGRSTDNIITLLGTYNIDDTTAQYLYGGSIKQGSGGTEVLYAGLKVLGAVNNANTQLEVIQDNTVFTQFWGNQSTGGYNGDDATGVLMRCMIKVRDAGADIDGMRLRVQARHWGDSYDFFNVTMGEGESVAAIGTTPDAQNPTAQSTVTNYTHVTNTPGYQLISVNSEGNKPYYSKWTYGADTSGDGLRGMWEFVKDLVGNGTSKTHHGINGELFLGVTHSYPFGNESGNPFLEDDVITWGTGATAGTGLLLALNDQGATGTVWMQLLTGVAPTSGMTVSNEAADGTHDLTSAPTKRTVPKIFLGSYTGTIIGAFGIGIDPGDIGPNDSVQDLLGVAHTPDNLVTFTIGTTVSGEDYILIGNKDTGNNFEFDQFTVDTDLDGDDETQIVILEDIPADTPTSGSVRVTLNNGKIKRVAYSSWATKTFTLTGGGTGEDFLAEPSTGGKGLMISYIDKLADSTTAEYEAIVASGSRTLWCRVRNAVSDPPMKTFEGQATMGTTGGTATISRIDDA